MAPRSGSVRDRSRLASSGARVARENVRLGAIGAALPAATATTLAHRLPILAGVSSASALWQAAEIWRMTFEKPVAIWQSWLSLGRGPGTSGASGQRPWRAGAASRSWRSVFTRAALARFGVV